MGENVPPRIKERVPFRKTRAAIADIYRILRAYRPIAGGLLETTADGFTVRNPVIPAAKAPTLQFTPSLGEIEGDEAKALTIAPGWVLTEWADGFVTDQFEIPMRYKFFMPHINGVPLVGDPEATPDPEPVPTLTLDAGQKTSIWLELILMSRQVQVGATLLNGAPSSLGPGVYGNTGSTNLGPMYTDKHTQPDHTHPLPDTGDTGDGGGFTHDHQIVTDTTHVHETQTYFDRLHYHKDNEAEISFITTAHPAEPNEGETAKYINVGYYDLDADGKVTDSEWYIEGGAFYMPQQSFTKGRSTLFRPDPDNGANPKEAST